jgi:hypothetical protein
MHPKRVTERGLLAAAGVILALAMTGPATATTFDCATNVGLSNDVNIAGNVVTNNGCLLSTLANDPESGSGVAAENFFGVSDWTFLGKTAITTTTGSWSVAATLWDTYAQIMLLFKGPDASAPFEPDGTVAYLLNDGATSGTWTSPYSKGTVGVTTGPNKFNLSAVSHISVYGAGTVQSVTHAPIPPALPLFASGLAAMGFIAWRRKRRPAAR